MSNKKAVVGSSLVCFFIIISLFGQLLTKDPTAFLSTPLSPPSAEYWFGTNGQGQDVFAQTIAGGRQTLLVGFITGFLVVIIGSIIGILYVLSLVENAPNPRNSTLFPFSNAIMISSKIVPTIFSTSL